MINKIQVIERLKYNAALWLQQLNEIDRKDIDKLNKQKALKKIADAKAAAKRQAEITGTTNQPEAPQAEEQPSSQPLNISRYAKKAIERQQSSGNTMQQNASNVTKELQQGDSSNTSHNHKLKGSRGNKSRSIHVGATKGKITIQTNETPKGTTITSVSPHENTKNNKRTRHGLAGQNAATSGGTGFRANNTPKNKETKEHYYYTPAAARWLNEWNYELQSRRQFLLEELYIRREKIW